MTFAPTIVVASLHDHGIASTRTEGCDACVVAHSPGVIEAGGEALAAPLEREAGRQEPDAEGAPAGFSFAAPLACGPP